MSEVSLNFTSGSGRIGDIFPGWTVHEDATPVAPGAGSGGTGYVNLGVAYGEDSEFVVGNSAVFSHPDLGDVVGRVDTFSGSGMYVDSGVSLTMGTVLQRLNVNKVMPAVWRDQNVTPPKVFMGPLVGQVANIWDIAVNASLGRVYVSSYGSVDGVERQRVLIFDAQTGDFISEFGFAGSGAGGFGTSSSNVGALEKGPCSLAVDGSGNVLVHDPTNNRVNMYTGFGAFISSFTGTAGLWLDTYTSSMGVQSDGTIVIGVSNAIEQYSSSGSFIRRVNLPEASYPEFYSPNCIAVDSSDRIIAVFAKQDSLGPSVAVGFNEIRIYDASLTFQSNFTYQYEFHPDPVRAQGGSYVVADPDGSTMWVRGFWSSYFSQLDYTGTELGRQSPELPQSFDITRFDNGYAFDITSSGLMYVVPRGNMQTEGSVWWQYRFEMSDVLSPNPLTLEGVIRQYINTVDPNITLTYNATTNPNVAAPGWSGNLWGKLNELCAAFGIEISAVDGEVTVSDIGTKTVDPEDVIVGSTSLSLNYLTSGRSINIMNYNVTRGDGIMWDAAETETTLSVGVGEVVTETIATTNYPTFLHQPVQSDIFPLLPGQYYVIASDNLPVNSQQWADYGGMVTVAISETVPGGIEVTLRGPATAIPGVTAPYSLAISDGSTARPAISVTGMGVFTNPEQVNLLTGADPASTDQDVALDIDNPFIQNLEQAYDRGAWACTTASGPSATLAFGIPSSALTNFADAPGAIVDAKYSRYRINSADITRATTSLNSSTYVTTEDIDKLWLNADTGDFDAYWGSYETIDFDIKPLRRI